MGNCLRNKLRGEDAPGRPQPLFRFSYFSFMVLAFLLMGFIVYMAWQVITGE